MASRWRLNRYVIITTLTLLISTSWLSVFLARVFFHLNIEAAPGLDAGMLIILGYWFSTAAMRDDDDDDKDEQ
jgi:putative flippase GtrA